MEFRKGQILKLAGKSLKGKNRVREHGEIWIVNRVLDADQKLAATMKKGMAFITPMNSPVEHEARWVSPFSDPDFEIVEAQMIPLSNAHDTSGKGWGYE